MNYRLVGWTCAALAWGTLGASADANRVVQEWTCTANGQYGLEIPASGEARSYLREAKVPLRITLRESNGRPGHTVEMKFVGYPSLAGFGHAFIDDSGSSVAFTSDVLRAVSTSAPSGPKVLIVERDGRGWRFLTSTTTLVTSQYASQLSRRTGAHVVVKPQSSNLLFTGECNPSERIADANPGDITATVRQRTRTAAAPQRLRTAAAPEAAPQPADDDAGEAIEAPGLPPPPAMGLGARPAGSH
ncbi:hypothetical protein NK718_20695 [Alsobacter sp. SYSU M60028]|uniref:Uncharacterized protein n=1 Tax=Alsobacter ponti TaxID=2962936 RepID=A0ABT1LHG8_9HYPH|nr:hypothetical protein [Alsobacter ponti]MCP8940952.1 hypothetical protein [Alsobacter ponti]